MQTTKINTINCQYNESLDTILNKMKKPQLKAFVDNHVQKGCSSLNKTGLSKRIIETISDGERLEYILCGLNNEMTAEFTRLVNEPFVTVEQGESPCVSILCELGYVYLVLNGEEPVYMMPEVVKTAFANINPSEFKEKKERAELIYTYMLALTNLYGICDFVQLVKIFNDYENGALEPEEALDVLFCKLPFHQEVESFGPLFANSILFAEGTEAEALALLKQHQGKEYYIPTREEIIAYAKDEVIWTPQLRQVEEFIKKELQQSSIAAQEIALEVSATFSYRYLGKSALMALDMRGIEMESYQLNQGFMTLLTDAFAHARTWENKGFRQVDLQTETSPTAVVIPSVNPIKSDKVGRNEACPCGSEKKYKKCCGR